MTDGFTILLAAQLTGFDKFDTPPSDFLASPGKWIDDIAEEIVNEITPEFPLEEIQTAIAYAKIPPKKPEEPDLQQMICPCDRGIMHVQETYIL
jgi:hypothetical protein